MERLAMLMLLAAAAAFPAAAELPRVIVSTDIGGSDPDDFQSMVHYLVYADRFETEGLISSPPGKGRALHIGEVLDAYGRDLPNLRAASPAYPSAEALRAVVRQGAIDDQAGDAPSGEVSEGARLIVERAKADDPRPLWVLVWGSITDVAQALHHDPSIAEKLRVYSIGSWNTRQDPRARDYIYAKFPQLWWIENDTTFRGMYMGGVQEGDLSNTGFPKTYVAGHSALGDLFMAKKKDIKMGDTPSVLYLLHGDPDNPEAPHWGGAFARPEPDARPLYWHDNPDPALAEGNRAGAKTVNRWREAYLQDWADRMDRAAGP